MPLSAPPDHAAIRALEKVTHSAACPTHRSAWSDRLRPMST